MRFFSALFAVFCLSIAFAPPLARAGSGFFEIAPGPLAEAHAEVECAGCHKSGAGVKDFLCLGCHQHEPLKQAIDRGEGLHAAFKGKKCEQCHKEHKGADAIIVDWNQVGGRSKFDHHKTGFSLVGVHQQVSCQKCHIRTLKSGRTSYVGLTKDCNGCHKNPHQFSSKDLVGRCKDCHGDAGGKKPELTAVSLFFDHEKRAGISLEGKHAKLACNKCHQQRTAMKMSMLDPRGCASCHQTPHGKSFRKADCTQCHAVDRRWPEASFSHEKTGFPLRGKHATAECSQCHQQKLKPSTDCKLCHGDTHKGRFVQEKCQDCHGQNASAKVKIDHGKLSGLALTGEHSALACRQCHRGDTPAKFEKFASNDCGGCHAHTNAHDGQFESTRCLECHSEGGTKKLDFDNFDHAASTGFALTGTHNGVACDKCHKEGVLKSAPKTCVGCHKEDDPHIGKLGDACEKCHEPKPGAPKFVHDTMSKFALVGSHQKADCVKCHVDKSFTAKGDRCADCHKDQHNGQNGKACESCHKPTSFKDATKAKHDTGAFRFAGTHETLPCAKCHQPTKILAGLGELCMGCHQTDDRHNGSLGPYCGQCHQQIEWTPPRFNHAQVGFALAGAHRAADCRDCHDAGIYQGTPRDCSGCHLTQAITVSNPTHSPELLVRSCDTCHVPVTFERARVDHNQWWPREGVHQALSCNDCHRGGVYAIGKRECLDCHEQDYRDPANKPDHVQSGYSLTCDECHKPTRGWLVPGRR